ncbi:MAG: hypothetical protein IT285_12100 [Bdellovibrionales bacterium]|nr:hypothetical protein [Bdellovibrionales bacterium]
MSAFFRVLKLFPWVWPAVVLGLSFGWDAHPWKLGGFGMYSTARRSSVKILRVEPDGAESEVQASELDPELRGRLREFARHWSTLGELAPGGQRLARHALESFPGAAAAVVVGRTETLRGSDARFHSSERRLRADR